MRRLFTNAASAAITVGLVFGLWLLLAVVARAQDVTVWAHSIYRPSTATPDLCGREETRGTLRVRVQCVDYPAIKRATGATMFPDEKGQQVWVRSSDPATKAFRIAMTYRKGGHLDTVVRYSDVHETMDSGASWVLGDVTIIAVEVTELRETAKAEIR